MSTENPSPAPKIPESQPDALDPNDSDMELDKMRRQTTQHAKPERLEDEGQSGG